MLAVAVATGILELDKSSRCDPERQIAILTDVQYLSQILLDVGERSFDGVLSFEDGAGTGGQSLAVSVLRVTVTDKGAKIQTSNVNLLAG